MAAIRDYSDKFDSPNGRFKSEPFDTDEADDDEPPLAFGPAALGLHRVGTKLPPKPVPSEPLQKLNARGMPARIRKKNRFIFVDDFVDTSPPRQSPKKTYPSPRSPKKFNILKKFKSPVKTRRSQLSDDKNDTDSLGSPDKKSGHKIGMRLRNLLKLPKAHKWVCFEYFYSNIDKVLFDGENDFSICLRESFPQLGNRKLTRVQWTKIRRMMGKPRRCSPAFFAEERKELDRKRQLIRYVQQRKSPDVCFKDLPPEIPMQLVIGTQVTARLRRPQDGLFTGVIDAVDTSNNTYRITFERPKLGTHSVPDYEVLSNEPPDTISRSVAIKKFRPGEVVKKAISVCTPISYGDPMLGLASLESPLKDKDETFIGNYPYKLLLQIIRLGRILSAKKLKLNHLHEMNSEAEKRKCIGEPITHEFRRKYAGILLDLEGINADMIDYLDKIQEHCERITPEPSITAMIAPSYLRNKCQEEAKIFVEKLNTENGQKPIIQDESVLSLITDLTGLMLQVQNLAYNDKNSFELGVLQGSMEEIRLKLDSELVPVFQRTVEVHMQRIMMSLRSKVE